MPTIQDVAREAGVSVATVSRVINGKGTVVADTALKVEQAIEKLGYQPNFWGRNLRRQESKTLLVLFPVMTNPYYANIIAGIENTAERHGYMTMIFMTNSNKERERAMLNQLSEGRADGAIMMTVAHDETYIKRVAALYPLVQCCEYCADCDISHVSIDNKQAAMQIMQHLISLSHERIGYIGSVNRFISTLQREQGYKEALMEAGLTFDPELVRYADADYGFQSAVRAADELLSLPNPPTAIFGISDVIALGALRAAHNRGMSVPSDLSVVGFDDVEYAAMFQPTLTTVSQPQFSLGRTSVELLLNELSGKDKGGKAVFLEHKFILRDSTSTPAKKKLSIQI